jgi:hypothetical protein
MEAHGRTRQKDYGFIDPEPIPDACGMRHAASAPGSQNETLPYLFSLT